MILSLTSFLHYPSPLCLKSCVRPWHGSMHASYFWIQAWTFLQVLNLKLLVWTVQMFNLGSVNIRDLKFQNIKINMIYGKFEDWDGILKLLFVRTLGSLSQHKKKCFSLVVERQRSRYPPPPPPRTWANFIFQWYFFPFFFS